MAADDPFLAAATAGDDPFLRAAMAGGPGPKPPRAPPVGQTLGLAASVFGNGSDLLGAGQQGLAQGAAMAPAPTLGSVPTPLVLPGVGNITPSLQGYDAIGRGLMRGVATSIPAPPQGAFRTTGIRPPTMAVPATVGQQMPKTYAGPLAPVTPTLTNPRSLGTAMLTGPSSPTAEWVGRQALPLAAFEALGPVGELAGQALPVAEEAAPFVRALAPKVAGMGVQGGLTGAAFDPNDPVGGFVKGAEYGGIGEAGLGLIRPVAGPVWRGLAALPGVVRSGAAKVAEAFPADNVLASEAGAAPTTTTKLLTLGAAGAGVGGTIGGLTAPPGERGKGILTGAAIGAPSLIAAGMTGELASQAERRAIAEQAAVTDDRTGFGNARAWKMARPRLEAMPGTEIASLDLRGLGAINNHPALGPDVGDVVLQRGADAIRQATEEAGLNPARAVFSPKGDEFYIAAPAGRAERIAARAKALMGEQPVGPLPTGMRYGVGNTAAEADAVMSAAKRAEPGHIEKGQPPAVTPPPATGPEVAPPPMPPQPPTLPPAAPNGGGAPPMPPKPRFLGDESGRIGVSHGSPHKFPPDPSNPLGRFDSSKIGTGEGAQSYGHGHYFAGNEAIARFYRDKLAADIPPSDEYWKAGNLPPDLTPSEHNQFSRLLQQRQDSPRMLSQQDLDQLAVLNGKYRAHQSAKQAYLESNPPPKQTGALYRADIDAEPEHFLDWDKPLSQQSPYVRERLQGQLDLTDKDDPTGQEIYQALADHFSPWRASRYLNEAGIAGNKYLDAGSRRAGTGDHNWVVFDDSKLNITSREGKGAVPVLGGLAGGIGGAAAGYASGSTPEERTRNAVLGGLGGALALGYGGTLAERAGEAASATPTAALEGPVEASASPLPLPKAATGFAKVADDFRRTFAPASRTPEARFTGDVIRARTGAMAQRNEQLTTALRSLGRSFDAAPEGDRLAFIDRMERGAPQDTPALTQAATALRTALDASRNAITKQTGKLDHFIENYFPHIWEDPDAARSTVGQMLGKRPLEGSKGFLKTRTIPTTAEGIAAGLVPVTTNPVDLTLLKLREMHKYLMGQQVLGDLHQEGLLRFVPADAKPPEGYVALNPKVATVTDRGSIKGQQYAPAAVAQVVNNYLSPGLGGNAVYDAYRSVGNTLNQAQLGLSAFHLGFTSLDAAVSKTALALEQLSQGHPLQAAGSALRVPLAPVENVLRGDKVLREYLTPGSQPAMADIVQGLVKAGGRVKMDDFYKSGAIDRFLKAWRGGQPGTALMRAVPAALEASSKPILEYLVPRQKLGVFADLWKQELERLGPTATDAQVRRAAADAWDSVDNRMGQLVYDNLFWNRAVKDLGMASVRSVGWNLGTIRELGGGLADVAGAAKQIATGQPAALTHRAAYVAALPITVGLVGGVMHYLATGQAPQELKDYYYPKTGRMNPDGTEERVQLPSYLKDVYSYATAPVQTLKHKVNPLLAVVGDMLDNKDFYGNMLRNPDDPLVTQVRQSLQHVASEFVPFGIQYAASARRRNQSPVTTALNFVGVTPAPRQVVRSDAENRMADLLARRGQTTLTPEQVTARNTRYDLERQLAANRATGTQAVQSAVHAGTLTPQQGRSMQMRSYKDPEALRFQQLTLPEALDVYQRGQPEERAAWFVPLQRKVQAAARAGDTKALQAFYASGALRLPRHRGSAPTPTAPAPSTPDPFLAAAEAGPR